MTNDELRELNAELLEALKGIVTRKVWTLNIEYLLQVTGEQLGKAHDVIQRAELAASKDTEVIPADAIHRVVPIDLDCD